MSCMFNVDEYLQIMRAKANLESSYILSLVKFVVLRDDSDLLKRSVQHKLVTIKLC